MRHQKYNIWVSNIGPMDIILALGDSPVKYSSKSFSKMICLMASGM